MKTTADFDTILRGDRSILTNFEVKPKSGISLLEPTGNIYDNILPLTIPLRTDRKIEEGFIHNPHRL